MHKIAVLSGKILGTLLVLGLGVFLFAPENLYGLLRGIVGKTTTPPTAAATRSPRPTAPAPETARPRELAAVRQQLTSANGSMDQQITTMTGSPEAVRNFWKNKLQNQGFVLLPEPGADTPATPAAPLCALNTHGMVLVEFRPGTGATRVITRHFRQERPDANPVTPPVQLRSVAIGTPFMNYRRSNRFPIYSSTTSLNLRDAARAQEEKFRKNNWEVPDQAVRMANGTYLLAANCGKLHCNVVFAPGTEETRGMNTVTYQLTR